MSSLAAQRRKSNPTDGALDAVFLLPHPPETEEPYLLPTASGTSAGLVNYRDGYGYLIQCAEPVDAKAIAKLHGRSGNAPI